MLCAVNFSVFSSIEVEREKGGREAKGRRRFGWLKEADRSAVEARNRDKIIGTIECRFFRRYADLITLSKFSETRVQNTSVLVPKKLIVNKRDDDCLSSTGLFAICVYVLRFHEGEKWKKTERERKREKFWNYKLNGAVRYWHFTFLAVIQLVVHTSSRIQETSYKVPLITLNRTWNEAREKFRSRKKEEEKRKKWKRGKTVSGRRNDKHVRL